MCRNLISCLLLMCCFNQAGCSQDIEEPKEQLPDNLVFIDEFETFNDKVWTKERHEPGWVNNELQEYRPENVSVGTDQGKSVLIITAERKGNNIYSGRVNSQGKMNFRTGRIEASIKLPKTANGLWPAFWMMGDNGKNWPTCGEIDILEMGEKQGILNGTSESLVNVAIHYGEDYTSHRQEYFAKLLDHSLQDGEYHIYALEKTANRLTITIDGIEIRSFDISPVSGRQEYFKDEYYALINLAVGGNFPGIQDIDEITALPDGGKTYMYVDWIKVFDL